MSAAVLAQVIAWRAYDALRRRHGSAAPVVEQARQLVGLLTAAAEAEEAAAR